MLTLTDAIILNVIIRDLSSHILPSVTKKRILMLSWCSRLPLNYLLRSWLASILSWDLRIPLLVLVSPSQDFLVLAKSEWSLPLWIFCQWEPLWSTRSDIHSPTKSSLTGSHSSSEKVKPWRSRGNSTILKLSSMTRKLSKSTWETDVSIFWKNLWVTSVLVQPEKNSSLRWSFRYYPRSWSLT